MPDFIDAFMMFVIISVIIFFALAATIAITNSPSDYYRFQGCSIVTNISENKTVSKTVLMPMGKGGLIPIRNHHTEYHHYYVCLNGSIYDAGWY